MFKKSMIAIMSIVFLLSVAACAKKSVSPTASSLGSSAVTNPGLNASSTRSNASLSNQTLVFDCQTTVIPQSAYNTLKSVAQYLITHPNTSVLLAAYTPEIGSDNVNIADGERRSQAAADYLELQGVKASQINTTSYGGSYQLNQPHPATDQCQVLMRFQ